MNSKLDDTFFESLSLNYELSDLSTHDYDLESETYNDNNTKLSIYNIKTVEDFTTELLNLNDYSGEYKNITIDKASELIAEIINKKISFSIGEIEGFLQKQNITTKVQILKVLANLKDKKYEEYEGCSLDEDDENTFNNLLLSFYQSLYDSENYLITILAKSNIQNFGPLQSSCSVERTEREKFGDEAIKIAKDTFAFIEPFYDISYYGDETYGVKGKISKIIIFNKDQKYLYKEYQNYKKYYNYIEKKRLNLIDLIHEHFKKSDLGINEIHKIINKTIKGIEEEIDKYFEKQSFPFPKITLHIDSKRIKPYSYFVHSRSNFNSKNFIEENFTIINFEQLSESINTFPISVGKEYIELLSEIIGSGLGKLLGFEVGVELESLPILIQVYLVNFLSLSSIEQINKFKQTLNLLKTEEEKYSFLNTFLACSQDISLGEKIVELAKYPGSEEIFKQYSKLINLQSGINLEDDETGAFLKTILSRGQQMLSEAYEEGKELKQGEKLEISDRYSEELVKAGAFTKKILSNYKKGEVMSMSEFNEISPYFEIVKFQGGDLLNSTDTIDMMDDSNYLHPELFSKKEYSMLYKNIQESYEKNDPGAIGVITRALPSDIQNKDNTLYFIKDKKTGEPLAACKIKNNGESEIYWGSHYVEKEHRADFGLGSYLAKLAFSENQNKNITALVINNNTTLELQINIMGFIGEEITTRSDEKGSTGELIKIKKSNEITLSSKDSKKYPNSFIKENIGKNIDGFNIECIDSSTGNNQGYLDMIKNYFNKGYILSRLFYDKNKEGMNTKKTYLVFQKNNNEL